MRAVFVFFCCLMGGVALIAQADRPRALTIYYIDTEGGQSTLFVGPAGDSLLVDTGNPGERDLGRILETLSAAGVTRIDHLWTTHYHIDHVGAMEELAKRIPIGHFYDHGVNAEAREMLPGFGAMYAELSRGKRTSVRPGDKISMTGLDLTTVVSAGQVIRSSLPGAGRPNPACAGVQPKDESNYRDPDNGQSAGFVLTYGSFRTADLGDFTWNGELELMCPANRIGHLDVYLTSHHGLNQSGSPALVHGLAPRVAIMNNGTRKGGALEVFQTLHASPGLEDLWQLHWSYNAGLEQNTAGVFIANIESNEAVAGFLTAPPAVPGTGRVAPAGPAGGPAGPAGPGVPGGPAGPGRGRGFGGGAAAHTPAYWLQVTARPDGSFTVTNPRNGFSKTYASVR
jgi:beta-lactamase superfamily II metal-dependent hydrolase